MLHHDKSKLVHRPYVNYYLMLWTVACLLEIQQFNMLFFEKGNKMKGKCIKARGEQTSLSSPEDDEILKQILVYA